MEPTSKQKLERLLAEGKISRERYDELISALEDIEVKHLMKMSGVNQNAAKKRIYKYLLLFLTVFALPAGLCLDTSLVWILCLVGISVVVVLYFRLNNWD